MTARSFDITYTVDVSQNLTVKLFISQCANVSALVCKLVFTDSKKTTKHVNTGYNCMSSLHYFLLLYAGCLRTQPNKFPRDFHRFPEHIFTKL